MVKSKNIGLGGILVIAATILGGYFSMPNITWVIQPQTVDQICPSFLINQEITTVQLKNIGRIPAALTVSLDGKGFLFVDDRGNMKSNLSISYMAEPGLPIGYSFKPVLNLSNSLFSVNMHSSCYFYIGPIGLPCLNGNSNICCIYNKTESSNSVELTSENC